MRNLGFLMVAFFVLSSCKKDEKVSDVTVSQNTKSDSVNTDKMAENEGNLKVEPLDRAAEVGLTVFSQNSKSLFYFNTRSNLGEIKINGKIYPLNMLNFTENEYYISGDGIKISAVGGVFKEMTGDCLYGTFKEMKVDLGDKSEILKDISVQDCPSY